MIGANIFFAYGSLALFIAALLLAAVSDVKMRRIPNAAPLLLLAAGLLNLFSGGPFLHHILSALLGLFLGGFPLLVLAIFRGTIGGGDVKLAASAGFALGWLGSYLALMAALIAFVLFAVLYRPAKKEKTALALPFAPFYATAGFAIFVLLTIIRHIPTLTGL